MSNNVDRYDLRWAAKSPEDRADLLRVDAMLERITYLDQLRAKLEKDIEFGDAFSTSELSTADVKQLLTMVERELLHLGASVERLTGNIVGPASRA